MKFTDQLEGDVVTFRLSGKLFGGEDATHFHGKIHEYLNLNKKKVLVDMSRVRGTTSRGLGMLISALASINNAGGRLVLTHVEGIEDLLALTRLITIFENYDSHNEAMKALRGQVAA
jgi:anti-sigma B factor antagonist